MSDSGCIDRKLGDLLSAYELGLLSESDTERFEQHLIGCEYCYTRLKEAAGISDLLLNSPRVKSETEKYAQTGSDSSVRNRLKTIFWPDIPLPLRPAITLTLLILLIYPAYLGLNGKNQGDIRRVQSITLITKRSVDLPQLDISSGRDGLISFVYRDAKPDQFYIIGIESGEGRVLFTDSEFDGFDEFGVGSILLPFRTMRPGLYLLVIQPATTDSKIPPEEYPFKIIE
jgi:hypothetical protein